MKKFYILCVTLFITTLSFGQIVISQVYSGAGASSSLYKGDFIELYNKGTTSVDISTYSIQYAGATAGTWYKKNFSNSTSIPAGKHFLIACDGAGGIGTKGADLPLPDFTFGVNLHLTSAKIIVASNQTALSGSYCSSFSTIVDLVGYGSASCFEGSVIASLSETIAALRINNGDDSNNNFNDFTIGTPNPRNSSYTLSIPKNQIEGFALYPNPVVNGKFTIASKSNVPKQVEIYSLLGKRMIDKVVKINEVVEVSNLSKGIYILKVEEEGKTAVRKLVIQ